MGEDLRMESQKLIFHPERVAAWRKGENIYPIELEIGLTNACNHRCIFCAVDYTGYHPVMLDKAVLMDNLRLLAGKGLKSIVYAGEGEPLIHKSAPEIIHMTKQLGIDAALSTNGVLLTPDVSRACLSDLTWIRFSTAAIHEDTYEKVQRGKPGDLSKVLLNMQESVRMKRDMHASVTIGVQLLLLQENKGEIVEMAKVLKEIGVDYFTIKPFSQHPQGKQVIQIDYSELMELEQGAKALEDDNYKVYFRAKTMEKKTVACRPYKQCLALPFMAYMDSLGNIWPCITFMGLPEYRYGNLYEQDFCSIWEGQHRKDLMEQMLAMDLEKNCRELCRLDEMNRYLDSLKHPGLHVNFI